MLRLSFAIKSVFLVCTSLRFHRWKTWSVIACCQPLFLTVSDLYIWCKNCFYIAILSAEIWWLLKAILLKSKILSISFFVDFIKIRDLRRDSICLYCVKRLATEDILSTKYKCHFEEISPVLQVTKISLHDITSLSYVVKGMSVNGHIFTNCTYIVFIFSTFYRVPSLTHISSNPHSFWRYLRSREIANVTRKEGYVTTTLINSNLNFLRDE